MGTLPILKRIGCIALFLGCRMMGWAVVWWMNYTTRKEFRQRSLVLFAIKRLGDRLLPQQLFAGHRCGIDARYVERISAPGGYLRIFPHARQACQPGICSSW